MNLFIMIMLLLLILFLVRVFVNYQIDFKTKRTQALKSELPLQSTPMESLIKTINKLQDVFAVIGDHKIDLPQIVVVGSQSSGKSSVLESLVGKSFLPRGTGIITRAPLILQMIRYSNEERQSMIKITKNNTIKEWACFSHKSDIIFDNFDEVRYEIERQTDILAGKNKGITHKPIVLKVYTLLYDLTLVDLPGITKVPVGDQPEDIDEQIQKLILHYVKQPNSIILAVVTANTDPSTSESLQIARRMDPEGIRTIAVVTKLDLIDKGTIQDTADLLCGTKIPVKLGIIGVVNRSQKDINDNKSMDETLENEREFLKINYPDIHHKHGNRVLANTLQNTLIKHIQKKYPTLLKNLQNTKAKLEEELKTLQTPETEVGFVLGLLKDIKNSYSDTLKGNRNDISNKILMGGARIAHIVNMLYVEKLNETEALHELTDDQIDLTLMNTAGIHHSSFVNEKALKIMIGKQLENLIEPSLTAVDLVRIEMLKTFDAIEPSILDTLQRFPKLNFDVRTILNNMLEVKVIDVKTFIKSYIETQKTCLNTTNPDFILQLVKLSPKFEAFIINERDMYRINCVEDDDEEEEKEKESKYDEWNEIKHEKKKNAKELEKQLFKQMLSGHSDYDKSKEASKQVKMHRIVTRSYIEFLRRQVCDLVPKRILHIMVVLVLKDFENELLEKLFTPYVIKGNFDEVLAEEESVMQDRHRAELMLKAVNKALQSMVDIQCSKLF